MIMISALVCSSQPISELFSHLSILAARSVPLALPLAPRYATSVTAWDIMRVPALGCGFNRSTQQIVDIVRRVFRSLEFSLGVHLIFSPPH
jgi:hypothetical protein